MTCRTAYRSISFARAICGVFAILASSICSKAQDNPNERSFPQPKAVIEKALRTLQPSMSGRLPVLDGFANPGEHPLDRYQRGYYQATPEVISTENGSLVRITTKVTAWYEDPATSHGGYQLLNSNGRLEADILDQLQEQLAKNLPEKNTASPAAISPPKMATEAATEPAPPKSASNFPKTDRPFSSSSKPSLPSRGENAEKSSNQPSEKSLNAPEAEIESLTELAKNIAHPKNLVAVKKSGTPVVAKPSLTAKTEFLASLHDEFEMIDFNADWVHVRISGLSRGWIWRNSVEMPEGIPDSAATPAPSATAVADLFHVSREETAPFPGDWAPLRSKNVKIISVEQVEEKAKDAGPRERLEYAKYLLDKNYQELSQKSQELEGIVVIFDSADGGMIAATTATLQQWRAGALTDAALWHKCFFDPPETFDSSAASGSK